MSTARNLQSWVENDRVGLWFKWVEWVALTSALFVAATYCDGWNAALVLILATASLVQCYMAPAVWLTNPLIAWSNRRLRARFHRLFLFGLVFVGSSVVLGCTIAGITGFMLSALA